MDFSAFNRQSAKGFLIILLANLKKQVNHLWVLIPVFLTRKKSTKFLYVVLVIFGVFLLLSIIRTLIRYRTFRFKVDDENFIVKEGLLKKKETSISFHKIVNVNLKQNIVQQFIAVYQVEIETAGSDKLEIKIEALSKENALALKEVLLQNKAEVAYQEKEEPKYLQKIAVKELAKVALTENHIQSFLLLIAFFISMYAKIEEYIEESGLEEVLINTAKDNKSTILNSVWLVLLLGVLSSLFVSFGRIFIKHFNLKTLVKNNTIEIKQGLFDYKSNTIKTSRIQYLKIITNPLKKLYGICSVNFLQASSGTINLKKAIKTVGVTKNQLAKIIEVFYKNNDVAFSSEFIKPHPYYKIQVFFRSLFFMLLLNLAALYLYNISLKVTLLINLIVFVLILVLTIVRYKRASFNYNNTHIQVNSGLFSSEILYFEYFKIQKITLNQSIFQKKRNIADLNLQTASGAIKIPCINYSKAISMYNHFLYTVEKSNKKWM